MLSRRIISSLCKHLPKKQFHLSSKHFKEFENPWARTFRILKDDLTKQPQQNNTHEIEKYNALMGIFPNYADIVIIGGGPIGTAIAYWLKEKTSREGIRVVVVEKDFNYTRSSARISAGALHQHYSLPENINLAEYSAEFMRKLKRNVGRHAEVGYTPHGYLVLANEESAGVIVDHSKLQNSLGTVNRLLSPDQLSTEFPWLDVSEIEVGCLGSEKSGWFDPWALFMLTKYASADMGTHYVQGEVVDFTFKTRHDYYLDGMDEEQTYEGLHEIIVKLPDGEHKSISFAYCILAAGPESVELAKLAKIGTGAGMLSVPLPIQERKRYMCEFHCENSPPSIHTPMTVDYTGAYFRRSGLEGTFLAGFSPLPEENSEMSEEEYFKSVIHPMLSARVPSFKDIKMHRSWSGVYDYNCFDDNGILGPHPYYTNLYIATGFSGLGIQMAPAIGRAVSELILDGDFKTIDLSRLGFDRFIVDKPIYELGCY